MFLCGRILGLCIRDGGGPYAGMSPMILAGNRRAITAPFYGAWCFSTARVQPWWVCKFSPLNFVGRGALRAACKYCGFRRITPAICRGKCTPNYESASHCRVAKSSPAQLSCRQLPDEPDLRSRFSRRCFIPVVFVLVDPCSPLRVCFGILPNRFVICPPFRPFRLGRLLVSVRADPWPLHS